MNEIRERIILLSIVLKVLIVLAINLTGFLVLFFITKLEVLSKLHFEQQLLSAFTAGIVFFIIWYLKESLKKSFPFELIVIGILSFVLISQSTLLTIDRSRSFYVISWAHHHQIQFEDNVITLEKIKSPESKVVTAIIQRIDEHIARGLMIRDGDKILLTQRGEVFYEVADFLATIYQLDGWKLNKS